MTIEEVMTKESIKTEYRKTVLLNCFKKICVKMQINQEYKVKIRTLFRQSYNKNQTIKSLYEREFDITISKDDSDLVLTWFDAHLKKGNTPKRRPVPFEQKNQIIRSQKGICPLCQKPLPADMSKIHVDHIVPFKLVGDELSNNLQALCELCNKSKNASVNYQFVNMPFIN